MVLMKSTYSYTVIPAKGVNISPYKIIEVTTLAYRFLTVVRLTIRYSQTIITIGRGIFSIASGINSIATAFQ